MGRGPCCLGHPGLLCCERLICTWHRAHLCAPLIFLGAGVQLRFGASVRVVSGLQELGTIPTDVSLGVGGAEAGVSEDLRIQSEPSFVS